MKAHIENGADRTGRRARLAWYAYDLGNTSVEFAIPLYLTIWIVSDLGVDARLFGLASAISSWAIGLSGPYIGVHADETYSRQRWFVSSVLTSGLLFLLLPHLPTTSTTFVVLVVIVAMAANYFFQLSSLIYNASMLQAARGANVVSVSSLGLALSFLGGAVGVGIMQLVVSGTLFPDVNGSENALTVAALMFIGCALPGFFAQQLWQKREKSLAGSARGLHRRMGQLWRESSQKHKAGWFLAGYFALNSSIMGITLYLPLYVRSVTGLEGTALLGASAVVVAASAAGAGFVAVLRPTGIRVQQVITFGLTLFGLNAVGFSFVSSLTQTILCASIHGFLSGALVPTVRGAYAQIFPSEHQALAFGLFGAVQRVSQGLGAALWPLAEAAGAEDSAALGVAAMGLLGLLGVPLFCRSRFSTVPEVITGRQ